MIYCIVHRDLAMADLLVDPAETNLPKKKKKNRLVLSVPSVSSRIAREVPGTYGSEQAGRAQPPLSPAAHGQIRLSLNGKLHPEGQQILFLVTAQPESPLFVCILRGCDPSGTHTVTSATSIQVLERSRGSLI